MRKAAIAIGSLAAAIATAPLAAPVSVQFEVSVDSAFDFPTGSYVATPLTSGVVELTFDIDDRSFIDYGQTTITTFGGVLGTSWSSPVTPLIPSNPYSGVYGQFYNSYTFPNVSDYDSTFIEEAASQANTYRTEGDQYSYYHIEVRATSRSMPRAGNGTADYAFTREGLLDFYRSFQSSGDPVYFNESYAVYSFRDGLPIYSEGRSWSDYSARVVGVFDYASPVPEPSALALSVAGLVLLLVRLRRTGSNPSIERTATGKPEAAGHVER